MPVPRLRVFAGPNGSGKSTIKHILAPEVIYTSAAHGQLRQQTANGLSARAVVGNDYSETKLISVHTIPANGKYD